MHDDQRTAGATGDRGNGREPDDVFAPLRGRPAPELDARRLWQRIEMQLAPRSPGLLAGLFPSGAAAPGRRRLALGLAAMAALVLIALTFFMVDAPGPQDSRFVVLTPAQADADDVDAVTMAGDELVLDVRLVRGFDGAPPDDVRSARALGVGGADALQDARARIDALLPFRDFGVVGSWQGAVASGDALDVELSPAYRLMARAAHADGGATVRLDDIELAGTGLVPVSGDLTLEPGRLNILGVLGPGAEQPELVLLIRARAPERER